MKQDDQLKIRLTQEFKKRLQEAAKSRGISVSAYIRDRLEDHVRADLADLRSMLKNKDEFALAA